MTDDQVQLLRVFVDQVERALATSARLFGQAEAGTLPPEDAKRAGTSLRELASQARWVRSKLPLPARVGEVLAPVARSSCRTARGSA